MLEGQNLTNYIDSILSIHSRYDLDSVLVLEDMEYYQDNFEEYVEFYTSFYDAFHQMNPNVKIYGPNIDVEWPLSSEHEQMLLDFVEQVNFDALAFRADLSAEDWAELITYVKNEIWSGSLVITIKGSPTDPGPIHEALSTSDIALWPASQQADFSYASSGFEYWEFEGSITLNTLVPNFSMRLEVMTNPLRGMERQIEIFDDDDTLVLQSTLPQLGTATVLGSLGVEGERTTYNYRISGLPASTGAGILKVSFFADNIISRSAEGSITIVG